MELKKSNEVQPNNFREMPKRSINSYIDISHCIGNKEFNLNELSKLDVFLSHQRALQSIIEQKNLRSLGVFIQEWRNATQQTELELKTKKEGVLQKVDSVYYFTKERISDIERQMEHFKVERLQRSELSESDFNWAFVQDNVDLIRNYIADMCKSYNLPIVEIFGN